MRKWKGVFVQLSEYIPLMALNGQQSKIDLMPYFCLSVCFWFGFFVLSLVKTKSPEEVKKKKTNKKQLTPNIGEFVYSKAYYSMDYCMGG